MKDIIINFTPTGMIPTKKMTPHIPITPKEIIDDVLKCAELGITMVHLHARDDDGKPTWHPEIYAEIIKGIRSERPDLIIGVSCSGRNFPEFEKRFAVLQLKGELKPDTGSLTLSSLNFNKVASVNPPQMIRDLAKCMVDNGIKVEFEAFDVGMINFAKYMINKGIVEKPHYFNLLLGNIACAQADILHAGMMINDLPPNSYWSFAGIGNSQKKMNTLAILEGGGIRVGLEDNIYMDEDRTELATNYKLVKRIVEIAKIYGRKPMMPIDCRKLLGLNTDGKEFGME